MDPEPAGGIPDFVPRDWQGGKDARNGSRRVGEWIYEDSLLRSSPVRRQNKKVQAENDVKSPLLRKNESK